MSEPANFRQTDNCGRCKHFWKQQGRCALHGIDLHEPEETTCDNYVENEGAGDKSIRGS